MLRRTWVGFYVFDDCNGRTYKIVHRVADVPRIPEKALLKFTGAFVKKPVTKKVLAAAVRTELDR